MRLASLPSPRNSDGYVQFAERFKAWWNGEGPTEIRDQDAANVQPTDIVVNTADEDVPFVLWSPERIALVQRLWGEASCKPGGAQYALDLVRPLHLQPEMSVLDLAPGLGAGTRAMSEEYGVWIAAMETDPNLCAFAADYWNRKGTSKVEISQFEPAELTLPTAKYDCISARQQICFLPSRDKALASICQALKPGGQIILTDYVAGKNPDKSPLLADWVTRNEIADPLWSAKSYRANLKEHGLEVRIFEDDSSQMHKLILAGWAQFVDSLAREHLTRAFVDAMIMEAELWLQTARAIDAGELRYLRIHAMSKPEIV